MSDLDKTRQEAAHREIDAALSTMTSGLLSEGYQATMLVHSNRDGTVDGEMRITHIPRGIQLNEVVSDMQQHRTVINDGWAQIMLIRPARKGEHVSGQVRIGSKYVGQIETNFVRMTRYRLPKLFLIARSIEEWSKKKKRRKADQLVMRVHWNPTNTKPER